MISRYLYSNFYLITISAQQKSAYVHLEELQDVVQHLKENNVVIIDYSYETSGKYGQLHYHAIAWFNGIWKPLTQYGDKEHTYNTYRIQWKQLSELEDLIRAKNYVYKDTEKNKIKQQQIIQQYIYRNTYYPFKDI